MILVLKYLYIIFFLKRKPFSSVWYSNKNLNFLQSKMHCQENFNIYTYNSLQLFYFNQLDKNEFKGSKKIIVLFFHAYLIFLWNFLENILFCLKFVANLD